MNFFAQFFRRLAAFVFSGPKSVLKLEERTLQFWGLRSDLEVWPSLVAVAMAWGWPSLVAVAMAAELQKCAYL
eukprot:SAG11_NODE_50_length_19992_cov_9.945157_2_plen_73_part_00